MTQQLLSFANGGEPIKTSIPLEDLLRKSTIFSLTGSPVSCDVHFPNDLWPLDVDPGQFPQVIQNITINARQAMPEGGRFMVKVGNVGLKNRSILPSPALVHGNYVKISCKAQGGRN